MQQCCVEIFHPFITTTTHNEHALETKNWFFFFPPASISFQQVDTNQQLNNIMPVVSTLPGSQWQRQQKKPSLLDCVCGRRKLEQ
jgi:hypothetical protein